MIPRQLTRISCSLATTAFKRSSANASRQFSTSNTFYAKSRAFNGRFLFQKLVGVATLSSLAIAYGLHNSSDNVQLDSGNNNSKGQPSIVNVVDENGDATVKPPTNSPPFPKILHLPNHSAPYELFGIGVRTVSFLSFHVYAVGIYIYSEDKKIARQILNSAKNGLAHGDLEKALLDPETGSKIISHLLDHDIRLDLRIVPVRNTDFGHLRDGFVRGVLGHPYYKSLTNVPAEYKSDPEHVKLLENLGNGINELKVAFSRKMSVPKHNILNLERNADGSMSIAYFKGTDENVPGTEVTTLGDVHDSNVSKIMFLHYLTGKKPASESARTSAVHGLVNLLN